MIYEGLFTIDHDNVFDIVRFDKEDEELVSRYNWRFSSNGYVCCTVNKRCIYLHRLVMGLKAGDGLNVDHINGDKKDNRKSNLRIVSTRENQRNRRKFKVSANGSKYKGVSRSLNKWMARISDEKGKVIYLGTFDTEFEAALAYDRKALEISGANSCLNFPPTFIESIYSLEDFKRENELLQLRKEAKAQDEARANKEIA